MLLLQFDSTGYLKIDNFIPFLFYLFECFFFFFLQNEVIDPKNSLQGQEPITSRRYKLALVRTGAHQFDRLLVRRVNILGSCVHCTFSRFFCFSLLVEFFISYHGPKRWLDVSCDVCIYHIFVTKFSRCLTI